MVIMSSVLCGKPTPNGEPCQRPVTQPGGPCGVSHPPPGVVDVGVEEGVAAAGPGPDPFAPADGSWVAKVPLAADPQQTATVLERLAADPDPAVREIVAGNDATPPDTLSGLAADPDPRVRAAVARNKHLPSSAAFGMLGDPDLGVMTALLVENGQVFDAVEDDALWADVAMCVQEDRPLPPGLVASVCAFKLDYRRYPDVIEWFAGNYNVPVEDLDHLADAIAHIPENRREHVWAAFLGSMRGRWDEATSGDVAHPHDWTGRHYHACLALVTDPYGNELYSLFDDDMFADSWLDDVVSHPQHRADPARIESAAAAINTFPGFVLADAATDARPEVRRLAASFGSCPPDTLAGLASDPDPTVRAAVAANPNASPAARSHAGLLND